MSTMNSEVYDALIDADADEAKVREAAKSVAQYDNDIVHIKNGLADIKASLRTIQWVFSFTLAFVAALAWRVLQ